MKVVSSIASPAVFMHKESSLDATQHAQVNWLDAIQA